ncbi:MAG: hypothetical protein UY39_C0028G0008 [Candidatus Kaiserbacteria bacterium GW2011_GWC2_49_12]|uniref:Bacterial spore germination immunoglobulin-like domain-containing protein n=4 Tax=Candidatus Kaiseribacteriota TaxID=1752734 RepID=A0A0G1ZDK7_9BACT|nr:MAG: hypothetical protein UY39_C0028G0008 [Candidatus Kaiserbacteria bacterium GW2011_GWC2_49_12]KKW17269.1 MAG: hypothetical protein UY57_C0020G0008 [Candidatus Kaiserbacteria bacterium GW2011_GWB1_50_17]KKW18045.1 MAG: hypothetical protein UY59_C0018G0010 [Candidatus Kaiserbacteria bacterium GW2011_GWA1_50_28]OGG88351.1 MAG: hypothetical protein A3H15_00460 [Candidatus Kaiserbacteria bacterium RIFCSPLOWO2_12_FULL_50_28]HCM43343.1 hypothetical protein [Candidatus Kaiserbacteria bacterium]
MDKKLVVALVILFFVILAGAVLLAWPTPIKNGNDFVEPPFISANVTVSSPAPDSTVPSSFTLIGRARGNWYFEASFPVEVQDANGNVVGQGLATAEGEWMTTEFVPFSAPVTIENYSGPATLVLIKDNPSGLPEHDDSVSFPITVQ